MAFLFTNELSSNAYSEKTHFYPVRFKALSFLSCKCCRNGFFDLQICFSPMLTQKKKPHFSPIWSVFLCVLLLWEFHCFIIVVLSWFEFVDHSPLDLPQRPVEMDHPTGTVSLKLAPPPCPGSSLVYKQYNIKRIIYNIIIYYDCFSVTWRFTSVEFRMKILTCFSKFYTEMLVPF